MGLASARQDLQVGVMGGAPSMRLHEPLFFAPQFIAAAAALTRLAGDPFPRSFPCMVGRPLQGAGHTCLPDGPEFKVRSCLLPRSGTCLPPALPRCLHVNACPLPLSLGGRMCT